MRRRVFEIDDPFSDHDMVALPLDQRRLHEFDQTLGLPCIVPVSPKFRQQAFLVTQPLPAQSDIIFGLHEKRLLGRKFSSSLHGIARHAFA